LVTVPALPPILNEAAVPVMLVPTSAEGVPRFGVTKIGEVAKTAAPEPVSSVNAPERFAEEKEPSEVVLPDEVTAPVRLASVVTVPALPLILPVMVLEKTLLPEKVLLPESDASPKVEVAVEIHLEPFHCRRLPKAPPAAFGMVEDDSM
jgi:hypothetical protein